MFAKIIQTIFSKGLISIINFLVVLLTARVLGTEGRGEISIMFLNITVVLLFNDIIGGGSLVYLIPKKNPFSLLLPALVAGILTALIIPFLFNLWFHYSTEEFGYFITLTLLSNLSSISNVFLNGFEKIKQTNIASVSQSFMIISLLVFQFLFSIHTNVYCYYRALAAGYFINLLISIFYLRKDFEHASFSWKESFYSMASYGLVLQAGNLFQLFNYRFCYYVLDRFNNEQGRKEVGVFSTAASVSEAVWVIMNGIAMVQYATLSNRDNRQLAINITVKLAKISFALSVIALLILNVLPESFFIFLFGKDFAEMKKYCLMLAPGIAACGLSGIYAHYFAAAGNMKISSASALVGLVVTSSCSLILIPVYGTAGAAYTNCASYIISSLFLIFMFHRESKTSIYSMFFKWNNLFPLASKS